MTQNRYQWARGGDVNAFFGLMLDNIAGLVLLVSLLHAVFKFPVDFALGYMVPGTAIGVLVGDILYTALAFWHSRKTGNSKVTAMPLGLDTPSTFGMVFLVLGPAFGSKFKELAKSGGWEADKLREAVENNVGEATLLFQQIELEAATYAWHIGICAIFLSGLVKFALSFCSNWIRNVFPRAGLLGSLAAIALVLITFTPLEKVAANPLVGFTALIIVLITLIARAKLPGNIPGALAAVLGGCLVWAALLFLEQRGVLTGISSPDETQMKLKFLPREWLTVFSFAWLSSMGDALGYLPYIFPFAVATVIGGIDCAESAASAGDDFDTNTIIGIEAFSTVIASLCGGVIQSTPYIGHPAYKAMGGRAAYTLATALFIGGAGVIGYFSLIFHYIPEAAVMPILIFIGIEITAQSFHVTPKRHYAAIAVACLPALVKLIVLQLGIYVAFDVMSTNPGILNLNALAGGFIITSLIWSSALAKIIDRQFTSAAIYFAVGGMFVLFGVMHSPADDQMFLPTQLSFSEITPDGHFSADTSKLIVEYAVAYLIMAVIVFGYGQLMKNKISVITTDEEFDALID
ncbi:MAG: permease [Mariniblastus sp.]|nr:permease [Mariniblastus sp.]